MPINAPVEDTKTRNVAVALVLLASTCSTHLPESYSARWTETVSVACAAGFTVRTAETDVPADDAVIVPVLDVDSEREVTLKSA